MYIIGGDVIEIWELLQNGQWGLLRMTSDDKMRHKLWEVNQKGYRERSFLAQGSANSATETFRQE